MLYTMIVNGEVHVLHASWEGILSILAMDSFSNPADPIVIKPYIKEF